MPGMSIVCNAAGVDSGAAEAALDRLLHDRRYVMRVLHHDRSRLFATTAYPDYPVASYRFGSVQAWVEGRFYGNRIEPLSRRLERLSELVSSDAAPARVADWLSGEDGEFVVYLFDTRGERLHVVTDELGRLPIYYQHAPGRLLVSRELSFVAACTRRVYFDQMAIAQQLLLGHPLGDRTLLDDVVRLPGASYLRVSGDLRETRLERLRVFEFGPQQREARSLRDNGRALAEQFVEACESRCLPGHANVVSMSGGFDSRAIAAGLHASGAAFSCATFLDHVGTAAADVGPAEKVARLFGSPWTLTRLGPPRLEDVFVLLRMMGGMNSLAMSFLLPFLRRVGEEAGWSAFLATGELGLVLRPETAAPAIDLADPSDLAAFVIRRSRRLPLEIVARVVRLKASDIADEIERHLAGYPEQALIHKFVHFVVYERMFNWHCAGEDRNRCFLWTTSPFAAASFFHAAMNCPDAQKRHYLLYREFLLHLSAAAAEIDHAGYGVAITAPEFDRLAKVATLLADDPRGADPRGEITDVYERDSAVMRLMGEQLHSCSLIGEYLARDELEEIVSDGRRHGRDQVDALFTVTSAIEFLGTGRSVLAPAR